MSPLSDDVRRPADEIDRALPQKKGRPDALRFLVEALRDEDEAAAEAAAEAIRRAGDPRALKLVARLLKEESEEVKGRARLILIDAGARAVEHLLPLLSNRQAEVRLAAAAILGDVGDSEAVKPLIRLLDDKSASVRCAAAVALGQIADPRAIEPLAKALGTAETWVRRAAAESLACADDGRAANALGETLRAAVESKNHSRARFIIEAFATLNRPEALKTLAALSSRIDRSLMPLLVKSAAQLCRKSVAAALSPDEKKSLRSAFEIFLDSERIEETIDALTGLRFVGDDDSARRVVLIMSGRDEEEVVQAAIETLLEILNPKHLAGLIGGGDEDVRLAAIRAAGILGLRECVPALIACWESGAPETRLVILEALEQTPDARAAGLLMNAADSGENDALRNAALRALAKIDTAGAAAFFLEKFRQNDDRLRERLVAALDASDSIEVSDGLAGLLDESGGELQRWALKALAPRRYPPAKPALWRLMRSEDAEIRRAAARAFLHLAGARDAGRLAELLADRDDEIRVETAAVCADIHSPEVIEALRKNALDFNALVAAQSMKALGTLGDSDAIPLLEGVLESSERTRVSAAIWAIEEIGGEAALSALGRRRSHPDPRVRAEIARSAARIRFRLLYIE